MMQKRVLNRIFTLILAAMLLVQTFDFAVMAAAAETKDDVIIAINPTLSSTSKTNGSISFLDNGQKSESEAQREDELVGVSGIRVDPDTGKWIYILEPDVTVPMGESMSNEMPLQETNSSTEKKIKAYSTSETQNVQLLYTGTYCTVWGSTSDDKAIQLSEADAEKIGKEFDEKCPQVIDAFGEWNDQDKDGKLAIFCYDIKSDYVHGVGDSYTAGFFRSADMANSNGYVGKISTGTTNMGTDCIHLDTYPGMAKNTTSGYEPFEDIEDSYSTLVHEFQHMINFSYRLSSGYGAMDSYLNEGFSMAAEQMICGTDSTKSRITYFNNASKYEQGTGLCYWDGTLSNYCNSYLFCQYIRTRYGQLTGTDGSTIFKTILKKRQEKEGGDTLQMIADILQTTKQDLVSDFWIAVYKKDATGKYGFMGELWAENIKPNVTASPGDSFNIYNGGAVFFKKTLTVSNRKEVNLISTNTYVPLSSIALSQTELSLNVGQSQTLTVKVSPDNATITKLTWTSSDSDVAKVDEKGKVTGASEGTAVITASADEGLCTATCTVTVKSSGGGGGGGSSGGCYVATAVYGSYDCPEVWTLRRFRDETLAKTWYGRAFIHVYYAISPTLVKWFGNTNWFKNMWRGPLDKMVANLNAEGVPDTPYNDIDW